jgi:hypothetical protein
LRVRIIDAPGLQRIKNEKDVISVFEDKEVKFFYDVNEYQEYHSFPTESYGSGVRVCVVDSGVDLSQIDFSVSYEYVSVDNGTFEDTCRTWNTC